LRFTLFLILSLLVHVLIYTQIGGVDLNPKVSPKQEIIDVELVPPLKKEEPVIPPVPAYDPGAAKVGSVSIGSQSPAPAMTMPEISIPKIMGTDALQIKIPKLNIGTSVTQGKLDSDKELINELNAESDKYHRSSSDKAGADSSGKRLGTDDGKDFFVIKNLSATRKLVSTPEKPVFSLSADTTVRASFKIDKEGSTYSILLLNRTDSKIERLAIDFIQKLKFNAVLTTSNEPVEITLYFRVR